MYSFLLASIFPNNKGTTLLDMLPQHDLMEFLRLVGQKTPFRTGDLPPGEGGAADDIEPFADFPGIPENIDSQEGPKLFSALGAGDPKLLDQRLRAGCQIDNRDQDEDPQRGKFHPGSRC